MTRVPARAALVAALLFATVTLAGASSDRDRYLELLQRKEKAQRLNAFWKLEGELAAKRTAYAVLDLSDRKLYLKVRGRAFKAIAIAQIEAVRGSRTVDPDELAWRAFTLQLKEGKGVETETIQRRTLSEEEKRASGRDEETDEPIGAEQGAVEESPLGSAASSSDAGRGKSSGGAAEPQKMAGVAGGAIPPDPPPKYHMGFDGGLSVWVVASAPPTPEGLRYKNVLAWAREIGRRLTSDGSSAQETQITFRMPLPLAQQIFRELLPGQRLLITQ